MSQIAFSAKPCALLLKAIGAPAGLYASRFIKALYSTASATPQLSTFANKADFSVTRLSDFNRFQPPQSNEVAVPEVFGRVHSMESFSAVDGPGVRFLVFVTGCAMRCLFCSNPDTWKKSQGDLMSSKDVFAKIKKVYPYLKDGGGLTVSGGEAMLQPEFVAALFQEVHAIGLNTCIDTTGQGTKRHNWDVVLPHTDHVLFCIKHMDPRKYEQLTGLKPKPAFKFAEELAARNIPYYIRYVLIPGFTDDRAGLESLVEFCHKQPSFKAVELLPYHTLGRRKWEEMHLSYPLDGVRIPTKAEIAKVKQFFASNKVEVICNS